MISLRFYLFTISNKYLFIILQADMKENSTKLYET